MTKLTGAALDRAVAHAMGLKSANNCDQWGASMTRDEIDTMWQQAMQQSIKDGEMFTRYHFAKLIVEAEREECAKILDANAMACESPIMRSLLQSNAQAIRVRGQV